MNRPDATWPRGVPSVGQMARRSREVTARDIERFTEISGDRNPLHYDEALARRTRFGSIVVQGGVTSAILNAVVAEDLPGPGTVFLQVNWNFKAPVRPGDTITHERGDQTAPCPQEAWAMSCPRCEPWTNDRRLDLCVRNDHRGTTWTVAAEARQLLTSFTSFTALLSSVHTSR
jgi:hypothetical protein